MLPQRRRRDRWGDRSLDPVAGQWRGV